MASTRKEIGELLVENGQITPEELELAETERDKTGESIGAVLAKLGLATESNLKNVLELQYGVNYVNLAKKEPEYDLIQLLPEEMIREQLAVPVDLQGERVTIAMVDPSDTTALDLIKKHFNGKQLKTVVCLEEEFVKFVNKAYPSRADDAQSSKDGDEDSASAAAPEETVEAKDTSTGATNESPPAEAKAEPEAESESELEPELEPQADVDVVLDQTSELDGASESKPVPVDEVRAKKFDGEQTLGGIKFEELAAARAKANENYDEIDLAKRAQEEAIVLLANQILGSAIKRHCSNIHIQVGAKEAQVYYRLNGALFVDRKLPNTIVTALVARYKMMARLSLKEQSLPQDGHIKVKSASKGIVCLVSVVPGDHGENLVIWIV